MMDIIADSYIASVIREQAMPWVRATHFLGIGLVLGTILVFDIRLLLGHFAENIVAGHFAARRPALIGFILAAVSGALLFLTQPDVYFSSPPFLAKLTLIVLAGFNMLVFQFLISRSDTMTFALKLCAFISAICWIGVVVASCWIPFW